MKPFLSALLLWATVAAVFGGDETPRAIIHVRLIYATNEPDGIHDKELADLEPRFRPDFGYKHYKLLGEKRVELKEGDSVLLDLGHSFGLSLKHVGTRQRFHLLHVDLFHQKKWLFWFETSVKQRSEPLFIKGPWTEKGLVIIALEAK